MSWRTKPLIPGVTTGKPYLYDDDALSADAHIVSIAIDNLAEEVKAGLKLIAESVDELTTTLEEYLDEWEKERVS